MGLKQPGSDLSNGNNVGEGGGEKREREKKKKKDNNVTEICKHWEAFLNSGGGGASGGNSLGSALRLADPLPIGSPPTAPPIKVA